ncbi:MAG: hypothetical protein JWR06_2441, partial [Jatrophihabitans sp.]|nr:hypothetical protein [Jatrophihabitans sp.]
AHRSNDEVRLVASHLIAALTVDVDGQSVRHDTPDEIVVQRQGKTKCVEAWPEVGAGGRHADANRPGHEIRRTHA